MEGPFSQPLTLWWLFQSLSRRGGRRRVWGVKQILLICAVVALLDLEEKNRAILESTIRTFKE